MKRAVFVLLSVFLLTLIFIACNSDGLKKNDYETVSVSFATDKGEETKSLTSSFPSFGKDDYYWRYTAVKKDVGSKTGEKTSETNVKTSGMGLGALNDKFAIGKWTFSLYGYSDSGFTKKVYAGSANISFKGDKATETVTVSVGPLSTGKGTLVIGKLQPKSKIPTTTTQLAYVVGSSLNTSYSDFPTTLTDLDSGTYCVTIELSYTAGSDTFITASEPIQVSVYDYLTTTIGGNVDDIESHVDLSSEQPFTVTFNSNGGSVVPPQIISNGGKLTTPTDPIKTGVAFKCWTTDSNALSTSDKFDFNTAISSDTTLYAVWTAPAATGKATVSVTAGRPSNECSWVQLWEGGPKWAEFNVGSTISDYSAVTTYDTGTVGGLYAWGGVNNARVSSGYVFDPCTTTDLDPLPVLSPLGEDDDTATKLWGENWQMPSFSDFVALLLGIDLTNVTDVMEGTYVVWEWCDGQTKQYASGCTLKGWKVHGKDAYSQNSIFFPYTGEYRLQNQTVTGIEDFGCYFTSSPEVDRTGLHVIYPCRTPGTESQIISERIVGFGSLAVRPVLAGSSYPMIYLNEYNKNMNPSTQLQLTAKIFPSSIEDKRIEWSSMDTSVATVDQNGLVSIIGSTAGDNTVIMASLVAYQGIVGSQCYLFVIIN